MPSSSSYLPAPPTVSAPAADSLWCCQQHEEVVKSSIPGQPSGSLDQAALYMQMHLCVSLSLYIPLSLSLSVCAIIFRI